jgi:KaiC/GvpD/RAD55 family RecA-like ATPase
MSLTVTDTGNALQVASNNAPPLTLAEWFTREMVEPDFLLGEVLSTSTRMMIVGPTGLGKTMLALAIAFAVALGRAFLHWSSRRKGRVLYVDGEMSRRTLKRRLSEAARRARVVEDDHIRLIILSGEDFEDMPPLNTVKGQRWMDRFILEFGPFDLVIFDNVQALIEGQQKEEDTWLPLLPWVRSLTRKNIGQIWLYHTGHDESKSYGSKAREWQMDAVAIMKRVSGSISMGDLAFSIEFTKARERTPDNRADYEPITMQLVNDEWQHGAVSERSSTLNNRYRNALTALTSIVAERGEKLSAAWKLPPELRGVTIEAWRLELMARGIIEADDKNPRATFKRIRRPWRPKATQRNGTDTSGQRSSVAL